MNRCAFRDCENEVDETGQWLEVFDRYCRPVSDPTEGTFAKVCHDCFQEHDIRQKYERTPQPPVAANWREREAFNDTIREIWGPNFLDQVDFEKIRFA